MSLYSEEFQGRETGRLCFQKIYHAHVQLQMPSSFFQVDPEMWEPNDDFTTSLEIVQALKVVNNHTEHSGVALVHTYYHLQARQCCSVVRTTC